MVLKGFLELTQPVVGIAKVVVSCTFTRTVASLLDNGQVLYVELESFVELPAKKLHLPRTVAAACWNKC